MNLHEEYSMMKKQQQLYQKRCESNVREVKTARQKVIK